MRKNIKIIKNKSIELTFLRMLRWKNGFTPFDVRLYIGWSGYHSPEIFFDLTIFNISVFEFNFYDIRHEDD